MKRARRIACFTAITAASLAGAVIFADEASNAEQLLARFQPPVRLMADGQIIDTGDAWGHSGPTMADVDGDGRRDLISGSYDPGEFYLFRGEGQGRFKARETLVDRNANPILTKPDQTEKWESFGTWIASVDWEADGDLDLILGGFQASPSGVPAVPGDAAGQGPDQR